MLLRGKAFPGGARTAELCSYCRRAPSLGQRVLYFKSLLFQTCYRVQRGSKAIIVQVGTNTALTPELSVQYSPGRTILWHKAAPLCSLRQALDAAHHLFSTRVTPACSFAASLREPEDFPPPG